MRRFLIMNINEIHSDSKANEMTDSIIIVVFLIHWNKIIIDSTQRMINRFSLIDSTKHDFVCLNQSTRLAFIDRRCWLEIIDFDLVYSLSEMKNNFRSRMFKHFVSFFVRDHKIRFKCLWFIFDCFKCLIREIILENSVIFDWFNDTKDNFFSM
jgi:hypothetical protein